MGFWTGGILRFNSRVHQVRSPRLIDYAGLYAAANLTIDPPRILRLEAICRIALNNQLSYKVVQFATGVPWPVIAAMHYRECNQSFKLHLHNGDPITARTVHAPPGRPASPPPWTWQISAQDALSLPWKPGTWGLVGSLEFLERYNGTGYQKHQVNTPYLWDWTSQYTVGMYQADGTFSPNAKEDRPGCVPILKTLQAKGVSW